MALSRRTFVTAGGVLGLTTSVVPARAARATTASPQRPSLELISTTSYLFDESFSTARPFVEVLGVALTATEKETSRSRLEVLYDSRISTATASLGTTSNDSNVDQRRVALHADDRIASLSIDLRGLGGAEPTDIVVALPLQRHASYPHDSVSEPRATEVRLIDVRDGTILSSATAHADAQPVAGRAWGASVAAIWDDVSVSSPERPSNYSYPAFIRVDSVGPGPIPSGSRISIQLDANLIDDLDVTLFRGDHPESGVASSVTRSTADGGVVATIALAAPIDAGAALSVAVTVSPAGQADASGDVTFAKVFVNGPNPSSPLQRTTGSETAVAVSTSGHPRRDAAFTGTV